MAFGQELYEMLWKFSVVVNDFGVYDLYLGKC